MCHCRRTYIYHYHRLSHFQNCCSSFLLPWIIGIDDTDDREVEIFFVIESLNAAVLTSKYVMEINGSQGILHFR